MEHARGARWIKFLTFGGNSVFANGAGFPASQMQLNEYCAPGNGPACRFSFLPRNRSLAMKKFVMAAFCTLTLAGVVMADQFTLRITKVNDDGTVTGQMIKDGRGGPG